mmetsp:Transcript_17479/g.45179  ORF Transcript_17479/g.45179 Transcript_17479/m.45179 type:complete len:459 (+) Transcript_17479:70-1446(+)
MGSGAAAVPTAVKGDGSSAKKKNVYVTPTLLPPAESDPDVIGPSKPAVAGGSLSSDLPRRSAMAVTAPPSVPSLLSETTSALVVGTDELFVRETTDALQAMGVRTVGSSSVNDALSVLEEDIGSNGCITFDQIVCEAESGDGDEGGETLITELKSTSWPASVVLVTGTWPTPDELVWYAKVGARAVLRKPVNALELGRLFTHLKRKPHERLWHADRELAASYRSKARGAIILTGLPPTKEGPTPLHITAMGVGMVTFLHVHAGRASGSPPEQTFAEAEAFECESLSGVEGVNPEWIYRFVVIVMINLQLDEELLISAVILMERACRCSGLVLTETNWQSVLLAAMIVAAKTHYDEAVWLGDFVNRLRMYPLDSSYLHEIEMAFLRAIRFCIIVRPSSYYRYASEIVTLHDNYCPYRESMTCNLAYRLSVVDQQLHARGHRKSGLTPNLRSATTCMVCT